MKASDFLSRFQKSKSFWYIVPRALFFNEKNLEEFHSVLKLMSEYQFVSRSEIHQVELTLGKGSETDEIYRKWDQKTKEKVQRQMIEEGIIKPTKKKQKLSDHLANLRNHFNLMRKLGFAFFNKQKLFFISDAGLDFLTSKKSEWKQIIERQLVRLQFWNPSLEGRDGLRYFDFKIFPYIFTLKVLNSLRRPFITVQEFILFLSTAEKDKELDEIVKLIENFRRLSSEQRAKIMKAANFSFPAQANASVTLGLFGCTPTLKFDQGKLVLINKKRAIQLISTYGKRLRFIEYKSFEDWYNFIGRVEPIITEEEIIEYYTEIGERQKAEKLIQEYLDDIENPVTLEEALNKYYQEKLLEDTLEKNPSYLESGLKLIQNGRQYSTEVGRIDLLCIDKENNYVVVELKKDRASDKVLGQLLRYMGWVKINLSPKQLVRGIILGQDLVTNLKTAIVGLQSQYDNLVTLKELDLSIRAKLN